MKVVEVSHAGASALCEGARERAVLVKVRSGGSERFVLDVFESCKPKVFALIAYPSKNSLATSLEAVAALPKGGIFFVKDEKEEMSVFNIFKRLEKFLGSKIALVGGKAPWLVAPSFGPEDFEKLLEARVVNISVKEVLEEMNEIKEEETKPIISSLKVGAESVEVTDEDLSLVAKLHLALRKVLKGFRAAAINCFDLIKEVGVTPCISVSLFNSAGFPFACEGDLNSLIGLILTYSAFGSVGGVFNVDYIEGKRVMLTHCTAALTSLDAYSIVRHYETGKPAAIRGRVERGTPSVVARISPDFVEVLQGVTTEGPRLDACETQIWLELERELELRGNHRVWARSDDKRSLLQLIRSLGLRTA